jgi:hypothetical protein
LAAIVQLTIIAAIRMAVVRAMAATAAVAINATALGKKQIGSLI